MTSAEFEYYVPDERLRDLYKEKVIAPKVENIHEVSTLWYMLRTILNINDVGVIGGINESSMWANKLDKYTFHHEFLETLLAKLSSMGRTEGVLLVIKKLSKTEINNDRFTI